MHDTYGQIISFIVAILFMILTPSMISLQYSDNITEKYVETTIENFKDTCRETGYISEQAYQKMIQQLNNTGYGFDTKIECSKKTSYPVDTKETYLTDFLTEGNTEIMDACLETINMDHLNQGGKYYMRKGDYIRVTVTSVRETTSSVMSRVLTLGIMGNKKITATCGGFVGTNGYVTS